jgi:predicted metal-binding membrane protein
LPDHGPDLEKHPRFLAKTQRHVRVALFVFGVIIACAWALTVWNII